VKKIAESHKVTAAQVLLRWHLQKGVAPDPKSETPSRISANIHLWGFELSEKEMADLDSLSSRNIRFVNPFYAPKWVFSD
jgi:diketogulonate reductase-like aldo/keto reductase